MNTNELQEVLSWLKTTDLREVSYRESEHGFTLASGVTTPTPRTPLPASRFTPVASPCVGVFQWNEPGKPRLAEEGASVSEGSVLGVVETAKGRWTTVTAPAGGRLARLLVDAGAVVEYGQTLFFLEAKN